MKLAIYLGTQGKEKFDICLYNNPFVDKWLQELSWCLDNCDFVQHEVFASFLTPEEKAKELVESCKIINRYLKNFIDIQDNLIDQPQEYFNYLHLKFEQLNGGFDTPTRLFSVSPQDLKSAIRKLNFFVHQLERLDKSRSDMYISFNKDQYRRLPLEKQDYDYFQFILPPGTLYLHYVELGKDFTDLYKDNLPFDYANFRNLHYYSGEASLAFNPLNVFKDPGFEQWLISNGINPRDKTHGHGKIPLGHIEDIGKINDIIANNRYLYKIGIED